MRLGLVAVFLLVSLLPTVHAQAPSPNDAILLACQTVGGASPQARQLLPVCPGEPGAAPPPGQHDHNDSAAPPPAPAPAQEPAQQAQDLAASVVQKAQEIPKDPASAPSKALEIVAAIVDFVKHLVQLPVTGAKASVHAVDAASARLHAATHKISATTHDAIAKVLSIVHTRAASAHHARPASAPSSASGALSKLPLGELRQVLPKGK